MDAYERKMYTSLLIAAGIMVLIIAVFIATIIRHHRKSIFLYRVKLCAEITTLEAERQRIASYLHDDIGPLLSSVKFQVNSLDVSSVEDQLVLRKASNTIDAILTQLRKISANLIPAVLLRKGLIPALHSYICDINLSVKLQVSADFSITERLPLQAGVHLYRIIHGIIDHTLKHSEASTCHIFMKTEDDKLIINITANRKGYNYEKPPYSPALQNMLNRVEILDGELFINTKTGHGVNYLIEIPLKFNHETPNPN